MSTMISTTKSANVHLLQLRRAAVHFPQPQAPAAHPQSAQEQPSVPQPGMMNEFGTGKSFEKGLKGFVGPSSSPACYLVGERVTGFLIGLVDRLRALCGRLAEGPWAWDEQREKETRKKKEWKNVEIRGRAWSICVMPPWAYPVLIERRDYNILGVK
ncbi:hypothetical protein P154DRAFT_537906 [Amniculicola lignicola CBS 123094]|uniref:Uncharacterized protein n=1 Tax=Amniculicola lignicola CBS 123094 TaxID=1392246 RepID=A0A6A5W3Y3_9PLEO|nr:hypothetical protein P154DRAFT_537906 [Amniculicola lignicola CBS 123094]